MLLNNPNSFSSALTCPSWCVYTTHSGSVDSCIGGCVSVAVWASSYGMHASEGEGQAVSPVHLFILCAGSSRLFPL